ncbi:hypothetical protein, partial [Desulfovibrio sp.]|uniref:hypothetical protein n=1 Tax=Desulfovibrio sp. TaxID=885 RepID=UPI0025B9E9EF
MLSPDHQTALLLFQTGKHETSAAGQDTQPEGLASTIQQPSPNFVSDKGCCRNISKFSAAVARAVFDCGCPSFAANGLYFP